MLKYILFLLHIIMLSLFLSSTLITHAEEEEKILSIYNWTDYMPKEVLDRFTEETGIEIRYSTFDSNEQMYARIILTGGEGFDLIVPSSYFVTLMAHQGFLEKIIPQKLKNFNNIDKFLLTKNDEYAIPYCWGFTLLLVNSQYISPSAITGWNDLLKPEFAGKILLQDDLRDTFSMALYTLGYSINTTDEDEIKQAYAWLKKLQPSVRGYSAEMTAADFTTENVSIASIYNGDMLQFIEKNPQLVPVIPQEGVPLWIDSFAIPVKARHIENAYKFIDFILRPDISKIIAEEMLYSTPNIQTLKLLDSKLKNNNIFNPSKKDLRNSEFTYDVGPALEIYEKYWNLLRNE